MKVAQRKAIVVDGDKEGLTEEVIYTTFSNVLETYYYLIEKVFIFILLCALVNVTNAQFEYFNNVYDLPSTNVASTQNIEIINDGYAVFGAYIESGFPQDLHLTSIDDAGNFINTNFNQFGYYEFTNYADSFIETSDGNFLWGGSYMDTNGIHAVLAKINSDLNVIWAYDTLITDWTEFHSCLELSDGYLGIGKVTINENNDINEDYSDLLVTKLNFDGSLAWQQGVPVFNQSSFLRITKAFELPNGHLILFGSRYFGWDYFAIKLDSQGNYLSEYTWGSPLWDWIPWPVDLGNGQFALAWQESHYYYQGPDYPETAVSTPHLKMFDANSMTEEWDVEYEDDSLFVGYMGDLVKTLDGGFIICGSTDHIVNESDWLRSGYLIKTDSNGQKLWSKYIEYSDDIYWLGNDDNRLYDMEITEDGGFVACGTFDEHSMGLQQIWVVKGDCMGNLELPPISFSPQITQLDDSTFYCTASGENLYDFHWDFGNGETSEEDTLTYSYTQAGMYNITAYGHYCAMTADSVFTVGVADCMGNTEVPPLSIIATVSEISDSTFLFSAIVENLENITWFFPDGEIVSNEVLYTFSDTGTFEVEVCGWYCDSLVCDVVEIQVEVGFEEFNNSMSREFNVWPNPIANSTFYIQSTATINSISIRDISGRIVFTRELKTTQAEIKVANLAIGLYLVEADFGDGSGSVRRVVVE